MGSMASMKPTADSPRLQHPCHTKPMVRLFFRMFAFQLRQMCVEMCFRPYCIMFQNRQNGQFETMFKHFVFFLPSPRHKPG